jgi:hypothetical protein
MYQRDAQVAKFDAFKEYVHTMMEAGGLYMILAVLFLGALKADAGIDLAELGIDTERFQSYHEYAVAMADGRQSALFPQGKWVGSTLLYFSVSRETFKVTNVVCRWHASSRDPLPTLWSACSWQQDH